MKKILIADTLKSVITNGASFFLRTDIQIFPVSTNDQLLEFHRQERVNLIITQLDMPGMNGEELYSRIRNDHDLRQVSLIMFCADTPSARERAERCKPNVVLTLPPDGKVLVEKAQRLLDISGRESYRVLLSVKIEGSSKDRSFFCKSENLSTTGLLLETDRILTKGDRVVCSFFLPESRRIVLNGEVVRDIKKTAEDPVNKYGIKFFRVSPPDQAAIEAFINKKTHMPHL